MKVNPALVAPCGLYCGVCAIYMADRDNNLKFKERLVDVYKGNILGKGKLKGSENLSVEDIKCKGCLSDDVFMYCERCEIKNCTREKGYTGCHQCDEFPCQYIENFPMTVGKKSFCEPFHTGEKSALKNTLKTKQLAIFALTAEIEFSGGL